MGVIEIIIDVVVDLFESIVTRKKSKKTDSAKEA